MSKVMHVLITGDLKDGDEQCRAFSLLELSLKNLSKFITSVTFI
jgi:hypothetical protein